MTMVLDRLSRPLHDIRVSVTDRCNLRCRYCMPREVFGPDFAFMPREDLLTFEEILRLCTVFASNGARRIRLTGGEPLLRRKLERLVGMLTKIPEIEEVSLTTNGIMLASKAASLRQAGLSRVTVSLDALDPDVFQKMTDTPVDPQRVLAGIDAATAAGLAPVKVNMVVRRGINDHCVLLMAEHFRGRPEILRFIEYMDVGSTNGWEIEDVVTAAEILQQIDGRWPLQPLAPTRPGEVASRYRYRDGAGEIGLIHSISQPFCASCNRARLSADGRLYTCLFATAGTDLRSLLRSGATDADLSNEVASIWSSRSDRYSAERASQAQRDRPRIEMSYIGG